jgi:hypothetical protein
VTIDPTSPRGLDVRVIAKNPLGIVELERDTSKSAANEPPKDDTWDAHERRRTFYGEHVFITAGDEAKAFETFLELLRKTIVDTMEGEELASVAMQHDLTDARGRRSLLEYDDPIAHVSRVLDMLTDLAAHLVTLPDAPEEEDDDDDDA